MNLRRLGVTGLPVSVLGFGCGAIGGLLTKGNPEEQRDAIATALGAGINYFDTAPLYGNGASSPTSEGCLPRWEACPVAS